MFIIINFASHQLYRYYMKTFVTKSLLQRITEFYLFLIYCALSSLFRTYMYFSHSRIHESIHSFVPLFIHCSYNVSNCPQVRDVRAFHAYISERLRRSLQTHEVSDQSERITTMDKELSDDEINRNIQAHSNNNGQAEISAFER